METQGPRTIDIDQLRRGIPPTKLILIGALALIAGLLIFSSIFTIQPEEVGIVLRFGEYTRKANPGLNFKLPSPAEQVLKVPVQRQLKQEFGFQTAESGVRTRYSDRNFEGESLMLTGDLNAVIVNWGVCS